MISVSFDLNTTNPLILSDPLSKLTVSLVNFSRDSIGMYEEAVPSLRRLVISLGVSIKYITPVEPRLSAEMIRN